MSESLFPCNICCKIFNYASILELHYRSHTDEKPFQCKICTKSFSHELHLFAHSELHKMNCVCQLCNKEFLKQSDLEKHLEIHKDEREDKADVKGSIHDETGLKDRNTTNKPDNLHTCFICHTVFSEDFHYRFHLFMHKVKSHSSGETLETCLDGPCTTNKQEKQHICIICNVAFSKECDLNCHLLTHEKVKPHSSDKGCSETSLEDLNITNKQEKQHICFICNEAFSKECDLNCHLLTHKKVKPHSNDKSFGDTLETSLEDQNTTNKQKKQHVCVTCNEVFLKECNLNQHLLIHKEVKPHSSNKRCSERLSKKSELSVRHSLRKKQKSSGCFTCDEHK